MRIEAVAGSHFVFQTSYDTGYVYEHKVVVLHRDAFDVDPWPETGWYADAYEEIFQLRFRDASDDEGSDEEEEEEEENEDSDEEEDEEEDEDEDEEDEE